MKELPKKDSHEIAGGVQSPSGLSIPGFPNPGPASLPPPGGCTLPFDPLKPAEK
jgi:hypothetical protein